MTNVSKYRYWLEDEQVMEYNNSFTVSLVDKETNEIIDSFQGENFIHKGIAMDYTGLNDADGKPVYVGDIISKKKEWSEDIYMVSVCSEQYLLNSLDGIELIPESLSEFYVLGNGYEDNLLIGKYLDMKAQKTKGYTSKYQVKEYSLAVDPTTYTRKRGYTYFKPNDSRDNATLYLVFASNRRYRIGKVNYDVAEESADMMEKILLLENDTETISEYGLANILEQICNGYYNLIEKHIKEEYKDSIIVLNNVWYTLMFDDKDNNTILKAKFTPYSGEVFKRYKDGLAIMECKIKGFDESQNKTIYLDNKGIAEAIETINSILDAYKEKGGNV